MTESLDPTLHPYVYPSPESASTDVLTRHTYHSLKQFGLKIRNLLDSEHTHFTTLKPPNPTSIHYSFRMQLTVLISYYQEAATHLNSLIDSHLPPLLDKIVTLMEFMKSHPDHEVHASQFGHDMQFQLDSDPHYSRAFFLRDSLRTKIRYLVKKFPAPAYKKELHSALLAASVECDSENGFSAPGRFDFFLPFFLERTPWAEMIEPVVLAVLE
jgi:hypothetical protein